MTFLEICIEVYGALGLQGTFNNVNASNDTRVIAQSVKEAWVNIQNYRLNWKFLQDEVILNLDPSRTNYDLEFIFLSTDNNFGHWDEKNFIYDYKTLREVSYNRWKRTEVTATGEPNDFTIKPNDNSVIFTPLDNTYEVSLAYFKQPQILIDNNDVPILPQAYHTLIMYRGLVNAAVFFSSSEMFQFASIRADEMMGQLMREQLPHKKIKLNPLV
ncbi:hypothetical protein DRQ25_11875 [Candidatus Fermentibacteria bacterium]|nr:MAG: hypothetical protein DRQ25_11875 [Candidatus Fermentibacteria bacterium]